MSAAELAAALEDMVADADVPARWKPVLIRAARRLQAAKED